MLRRNIDPRAETAKRAWLCIVWGAGAGAAYLGLIYRGLKLIGSTAKSLGLSITFDQGLIAYTSSSSGASKSLVTVAIAALPVAIIAVLVLGIVARARPTLTAPPVGLVVAAGIGLVGSVGLLLDVVNTGQNRSGFLAAIVTIVLISILLRISRRVRQSYQSNPALVSAIVGFVSIAYLFLLNAANIPALLLQDIDFWLALVSFGIVLYSAINMIGLAARARRSGRK
jgi:hypothetical protein